jgi:hypothetical protein
MLSQNKITPTEEKPLNQIKIDELIDIWLNNANFTVLHPCDIDRLNKLVLHGYKRVRSFSSDMLKVKMDKHGHHFDEVTMDHIMNRVDYLISFCRSNYPKPQLREQIEYNRIYDPINGANGQ